MKGFIRSVLVATTLAAAAAMTAPAAAQSASAPPDPMANPCQRACLEAWVNNYLEAMKAHNVDPALFAREVKFTENGIFYFSPTVIGDYRASLANLGEPLRIERRGAKGQRGGLTVERYIFSFSDRKLLCVLRTEPSSGRIEQFTLYPYAD